jgi:hypothetical protein
MENPGSDLLDSTPSTEPAHPLRGGIAALRRIAFVLLLAGVAETAVWYGNARLAGSAGTFTSIAIVVIAGTLFLSATMAVLAFIFDLLIFVNANKTTLPGTAESRPLTTA